MKRTIYALFIITGIILFLSAFSPAQEKWKSLFNRKDLSGWETYVGPKEKDGKPLGINNDPMKLFSVVELDGGIVEPLSKGKIQIQSEGGELFVRNIRIRHIDQIPAELKIGSNSINAGQSLKEALKDKLTNFRFIFFVFFKVLVFI